MAFPYSQLKSSGFLRGITALTASAALLLPASSAYAATKPSPTAAKNKLDKLNSQVDKLANKYDKAKTQLDAAKKRLSVINNQIATEKPNYQNLRVRVAQMAVAAYKNGTLGNTAVIASKDPEGTLQNMSAFVALSNSRSQEMTALLASTQRLQRDQEEAKAALQTVTTTTSTLKKQKTAAEQAIAKQKALLAKSTSSSSSSSSSSGNSSSKGSGSSPTGSASGSASKAVNYAMAQLGKPYVFGGTGPSGYDCSGLTMMAWRAAGVSLPRVVPDQYSAIRHVSKSDLQPGDLVFFDGLGHEGIYVGGGRFIHAPHTGTDVQYASMSNSYWTANYVGAGRP
ncbi:NlpC/P60 family protein [Actinoallomurus sp. CA-150999]|uniref:C40 family peptidase n=1 Tax=Actinoallomurus sp. CA-150999 TaxID=3239887 RepID=UPI003D8AC435